MTIDQARSDIVFLGFIRQPILLNYYSGIGPWGDAFFMANEAQFLVIQQRAMMMALDYLLFFLIFLIPAMYLWKKSSVRLLIKMLNPVFLIYSGLAYMLGIVVAGTLYPIYSFHWPYIVFGYLLFVCLWEAVRFTCSNQEGELKTTKKKKRKKGRDVYRFDIFSEKTESICLWH